MIRGPLVRVADNQWPTIFNRLANGKFLCIEAGTGEGGRTYRKFSGKILAVNDHVVTIQDKFAEGGPAPRRARFEHLIKVTAGKDVYIPQR